MILHWSKAASLLLAAALLLTSCMPGVFAGADGVEQAAQEAVSPRSSSPATPARCRPCTQNNMSRPARRCVPFR